MPLLATRSNASAFGYGFAGNQEDTSGLALVMPSSVTIEGTSATSTLTQNGSLEFSGCTRVIMDGVFSSSYRNYIAVIHVKNPSSFVTFRLRSGGSATTASNYDSQDMYARTTTLDGGLLSDSNNGNIVGATDSGFPSGIMAYIFNPFLNEETAVRTVVQSGQRAIYEYGVQYKANYSADGIQIQNGSTTNGMTGIISIYGVN